VIAILALLAPAFASGVLFDRDAYIALDSVEIDIEIEGRIATGTALYAFQSATGDLNFATTLPVNAAISGLRFRQGPDWIGATADVAPTTFAPAPEGNVHDLLDGEVFVTALPTLDAGPVEIEVTWQRILHAEVGSLHLDIPLSDGGLNPSDPDVQITVAIAGSGAVTDVALQPGLGAILEDSGTASWAGTLSEADLASLTWTEDPTPFGIEVLAYRPAVDPFTGESSPDGYALVTVLPGDPADAGRVDQLFTFVLDSSSSMQGAPMRAAVRAASRWIRGLESSDRFNVVPYASQAVPFRGRSPYATTDAVDRAVAYLERQKPAGLSDPEEGVTTALKLMDDTVQQRSFFSCGGSTHADEPNAAPIAGQPIETRSGREVRVAPYVVLLTDGGATSGHTDIDEIIAAISAANTVGASVFAIGVGADADRRLLGQITNAHRGDVRYATSPNDVADVVATLRDRISNPLLVQPHIAVRETYDRVPVSLPDVMAGTELVFAFRFRDPDVGKLRMTGIRGQLDYDEKFEIDLPQTNDALPAVARAWAQLRTEALDSRYLSGETSLYGEIETLVQTYGIASEVVTLSFGDPDFGADDPANFAAADEAALDYSAGGECSCRTPMLVAGIWPLLFALVAVGSRRLIDSDWPAGS